MPDNIRALIPIDSQGRPPCLRYFAVNGRCPSGHDGRNTHPKRVHRVETALPSELQSWIDAKIVTRA